MHAIKAGNLSVIAYACVTTVQSYSCPFPFHQFFTKRKGSFFYCHLTPELRRPSAATRSAGFAGPLKGLVQEVISGKASFIAL